MAAVVIFPAKKSMDALLREHVDGITKDVNNLFSSKEGDGKPSKKGGKTIIKKTRVIAGIFIWFYLLTLIIYPITHWLWAFYVANCFLGISLVLIAFNIMHDASHGAYSELKTVNQRMKYTLNLVGGIIFFWHIKHDEMHHTYTNMLEHEEDTELWPLLRIHESQKWYPIHRYQKYYVWFLYLVSGFILVHYNDFRRYFTQKIGGEHFDFPKKEKRIFWKSKGIHFGLFWLAPGLILALACQKDFTVLHKLGWGLGQSAIGYTIMINLTGFIMSVVFQLAHIIKKAKIVLMPEVENDKGEKVCYAPWQWHLHQLLTTADFAVNSKFWTWCLGGLNFQATHHLFKDISHIHYPMIQKIIRQRNKGFLKAHPEFRKKYGTLYIEFPTVWAAIADHISLLDTYGKKPVALAA